MQTITDTIQKIRPEKARVSYYLPLGIIECISEMAEKHGVPVSTIAGILLSDSLDSHKTLTPAKRKKINANANAK